MTWPNGVTTHLTSRCIVTHWHMTSPPLLNPCHQHTSLALSSSLALTPHAKEMSEHSKPQKSREALISLIYTCQLEEGHTALRVPSSKCFYIQKTSMKLLSICMPFVCSLIYDKVATVWNKNTQINGSFLLFGMLWAALFCRIGIRPDIGNTEKEWIACKKDQCRSNQRHYCYDS